MLEKYVNFSQKPWEATLFCTLLVAIAAIPLAVGILPGGTAFLHQPYTDPHVFALWFFAGIAVALSGVALMRKEFTLRVSRIFIPLGLWLAITLLSSLTASDRSYAFLGDSNDLLGFASLVALALVVCVIVQVTTTAYRLIMLLRAVVVTGTVVALLMLSDQLFFLEIFSQSSLENMWMIVQGSSIFGNPDFSGIFLVTPILLALALVFFEKNRNIAFVYIGAAALMSCAMALTLTRAAWIGALIGMIALGCYACFTRHECKRLLLIGMVIAVALSVCAVWGISQDFVVAEKFETAPTELTSSDGGTRLGLMRDTLEVIGKNPILGTGPANYKIAWIHTTNAQSGAHESDIIMQDPHSAPLYALASYGLFGGVALLVFFVWVLFGALKPANWRDPRMMPQVLIGLVLAAVLIMLAFSALQVSTAFIVFLVAGILVALRAKRVQAPQFVRLSIAATSLLLACALVTLSITGIMTNRRFVQIQQMGTPVQMLELSTRFPTNALASRRAIHQLLIEAQSGAPLSPDTIQLIDRVLAQHSSDPALIMTIAPIYSMQALNTGSLYDQNKAYEVARRTHEEFPRFAEGAIALALAHHARGESEHAILVLKDYEDRFPGDERIVSIMSMVVGQE